MRGIRYLVRGIAEGEWSTANMSCDIAVKIVSSDKRALHFKGTCQTSLSKEHVLVTEKQITSTIVPKLCVCKYASLSNFCSLSQAVHYCSRNIVTAFIVDTFYVDNVDFLLVKLAKS